MRTHSGIWSISALAILIGGMIYLLFRSTDIIVLHWIDSIGLDGWIREIRSFEPGGPLTIPSWIIYSLPNGLWAFAYALILSFLWIKRSSRIKWFWLATIPILVFGFEFSQYMKILPGTFSMGDLLAGLVGIIAGVWIGIEFHKNRKNEKALD